MENRNGGGGSGAAPTGCYKCGRPGHWSRDCPTNLSSNPDSLSPERTSNKFSKKATSFPTKASGSVRSGSGPLNPAEKPKKAPRTRPKLTPELLLSDDGIGSVLRHFPRAFKYRGRGHEVSDLGNLLRLYADWHSHFLPYYPFHQFVQKVEKVGAAKRVRVCLNELRQKVSSGEDLTNLHKSPVQPDMTNNEPEGQNLFPEDTSLSRNVGDLEEDLLHVIYDKAIEESCNTLHDETLAADASSIQGIVKEPVKQAPGNNVASSSSGDGQISEELKARMEANRLKALGRAAARGRTLRAD